MNKEKLHNHFNAAYFSFAAISFVALLGSVWWGGPSFAIATPLNAILVLLGIGYIIAAVVSIKHAFCGLSWVGCSCGGKSHKNWVRSFAMILPLPIFAYFLFGAMIKTNFDDSPQSFETAKTQLELDKVFFGNVSAEGVTWNLAKKSFSHDYDEMGDRLTILVIQNMKARNASSDEIASFIRKHLRYHLCSNCAFKPALTRTLEN